MRGSSKAVFLSYASEDAEAAQRICDELRARGIEVWFDKTELRGGDAWDASIRKQVKDCALFLPIISANTQAREEGYFRLEWKLAVDRSHLIADGKAFLLPVAIDEVNGVDALVPDKFREVQWIQLPKGGTNEGFVDHVCRLLAKDKIVQPQVSTRKIAQSHPTDVRRSPRVGLALTTVLFVAAAVAIGSRYFVSGDTDQLESTRNVQLPVPTSIPLVPQRSIAVLPFVDMSEKKDQEYFSDGLAEELLDLLSRIPNLSVAARTSAFSFKGKSDDIPTIAKKLQVANVLEGSVRKSGNNLRVTVQLIRADNGYHLWSRTYDRKLRDVFAIQDDIATAVVKALKVSILEGVTPTVEVTQNTEAYTLTLQANSMVEHANTKEDTMRIVEYLRRSLVLDPKYAMTWASLSSVLSWQASVGYADGDAVWEEARSSAKRAIELDASLPDAHMALFRVLFLHDWNWIAAKSQIDQANALAPNRAGVTMYQGALALAMGQLESALVFYQRAVQMDPLSSSKYTYLGELLRFSGNFDEAQRQFEKSLELNPGSPEAEQGLGQLLLAKGDPNGARVHFERLSCEDCRIGGLALVHFATHDREHADHYLSELKRRFGNTDPYLIAQIHAFRSEINDAFLWLERAYSARDGCVDAKADPLLANIRMDPRFRAFLRKMKLPE